MSMSCLLTLLFEISFNYGSIQDLKIKEICLRAFFSLYLYLCCCLICFSIITYYVTCTFTFIVNYQYKTKRFDISSIECIKLNN